MKIATYNVNGIRARISAITRWLKQEHPEILCLQETKVQDQDFPHATFEELGYVCTYRGEKSYNGVACLTKEPPERVFFGFGDKEEETRIMTFDVSGMTIVNTYVPQGLSIDSPKFEYKLSWLRRLGDFFRSRFKQEDLLAWVGDFNVAPEPKDVYDPQKLSGQVGFHPREHRALADVAAWGFVDVVRKHSPSEGIFTFWDYRIPKALERGVGWRIDHIWASPALASRSKASFVDVNPRKWEKPSDHTVVFAEFEVENL
jgi:exodeoxyribonuclease III